MTVTHNLTRAEAAIRTRLLDVDSYRVSIDLTRGDEVYGSATTVRFTCAEPGADTFIEFATNTIESAVLNGQPLDVSGYSSADGLRLPGLAAHNVLEITANCPYANDGEGLHRLTDPADGATYLYTHFEANNAQRLYACFDQPDLKALFNLDVRLPADWQAVSNMPHARRDVDGDTAHVVFEELPRTSTYLTALCAGPLHRASTHHDGIDLNLYCRASMAEHLDADEIFALTKSGLDHFHARFGVRYPLPKYDQVAMPEYNSGATENFGCVVFSEPLFVFESAVSDATLERRAYVMFHEMAHMWFGDLVTPKWWDETWLKEAFASWAGQWTLDTATRFTQSWTGFCIGEKNAGFLADSFPTTHPIRTEVPDVKIGRSNFDSITYCKGASVLKQLAAYVGIDDFCAGLRDYFTRYQWKVADFADLRHALERASGRDLAPWASDWLNTSGFNTLRPRFALDTEGHYQGFEIVTDGEPARDHRIRIGLYDLDGDRLHRRTGLDLTVSGAVTPVPALNGVPQPDVLLLDDTDQSYLRSRFDERSLKTVMSHLDGFTESLPRALVWSTAWDMTRAGELSGEEFLGLVATCLPSETYDSTIEMVLGFMSQRILEGYVRPEAVADTRRRLAEACLDGTRRSAPGSGAQLSWANAFADFARDETSLAQARDWLAGTGLPDGLTVGSSLRWALTRALAGSGAIGQAEIDATVAADDTIAARQSALAAGAARPDPRAKQAAWDRLHDLELSNADQRAILSGFWQPGHPEALTGYPVRFLELLDMLWANGRQERAAHAGRHAGRLPVDTATVAAFDAWLAEPDRPSTLRRQIVEAHSEISRALRLRTG